ncbi:TonB-dependent receptor [Niveispirillum sp.]|uniref:TonB-dependent receptor domain-containing protein n=1 Tax=Niveispirillum sp. TaxID=1917217 RepID=UPI001B76BEE4|nr:TonB-dependent receptor [Niveispirillum sp.]MBP7340577.1 TonB-dependent receptor [Niveispirillum sp.]
MRKDPPNPVDQFGVATSFVGEAFPNTPRWQAVLDAEYRFAVGEELTAFAGSSLTARSAATAAFGDNPEFRIDGYMLVDLRAGLEADDGNWRLQVWGRNVTNRFYVNNVAHLIDSVTEFSGMPVTYGVSFSYRY